MSSRVPVFNGIEGFASGLPFTGYTPGLLYPPPVTKYAGMGSAEVSRSASNVFWYFSYGGTFDGIAGAFTSGLGEIQVKIFHAGNDGISLGPLITQTAPIAAGFTEYLIDTATPFDLPSGWYLIAVGATSGSAIANPDIAVFRGDRTGVTFGGDIRSERGLINSIFSAPIPFFICNTSIDLLVEGEALLDPASTIEPEFPAIFLRAAA